jgi:hypothetical protein
VYNQESFEQFNNVLRIYFNQLDNALRNAMAVQEPYELQVAKGQIAGASTLYKFGTNPDIDSAEETIWSTGGDYPWPTAAFTAFISSSSAADTSAGTGAQTVTVEGVDENYAAQTVTVNMNGTAKFVTRDFGSNTFRTKIIQTVQSNLLVLPFHYPFSIAEKTDMECRASSDTTNVVVGASFEGVLIAN